MFAAPAFLAISRAAWIKLGQPSLKPTPRGDEAEELSWCVEQQGLVPHPFPPSQPGRPVAAWKLRHLRICSVFADRVFHLYQGRFADNVDLFATVCQQIRSGTFSTVGYQSCIS